MEFRPSRLLLELCLLQGSFSGKLFQLFSNLLVFGLDMLQITFSGVEIMLILPGVKASVIFLDYFGLLVEKLALLVLHFFLLLIHKLATANVASPHALYFESCTLLVIKLPLDFEHTPVFLDNYCCGIFFVAEFFCLVKHGEVLIYQISMSAFTFF